MPLAGCHAEQDVKLHRAERQVILKRSTVSVHVHVHGCESVFQSRSCVSRIYAPRLHPVSSHALNALLTEVGQTSFDTFSASLEIFRQVLSHWPDRAATRIQPGWRGSGLHREADSLGLLGGSLSHREQRQPRFGPGDSRLYVTLVVDGAATRRGLLPMPHRMPSLPSSRSGRAPTDRAGVVARALAR